MTSTILWQEICAGRLVVQCVNGVQRVSCYKELPSTRVREGLQVLYAFDEGEGAVVHDSAGVGAPLDLQVERGAAVRWVAGGGLSVEKPAVISSNGPAKKVINAVMASNEITIEARIKPVNTAKASLGRIVTLSSDANNRNVTLAQALGECQAAIVNDIHLRTESTDQNGLPSLAIPVGTSSADDTHLVFTRDASGEGRIYVNGAVVARGTIGGSLANWDRSCRLALANELTKDEPWLGEYYLVAIYSRALTASEVLQNFKFGPGATAPQPKLLTDFTARPLSEAESRPELSADFSAKPLSGTAPLTVEFTDLSTGRITSWEWDFFNDGATYVTAQNPSHTYTSPGTYNVKLKVTGEKGRSTCVKSKYINVEAPPPAAPVANFTATALSGAAPLSDTAPLSGSAPLTVQFTDLSTGSITSWAWDFDNNGATDSTERNPSHTYTSPGTYTVRLVVTGPGGSSTSVKQNYITVEPPPAPAPVAEFTGTPLSGTAPLTVQFTDLSTGSITSWAWDFDNNGATDSTERNPSHTYASPGTYTVRLVVTGPGGSSTSVKQNYITVEAAPPLSGTSYYVDSVDGDDGNSGTSEAEPWQTLGRVMGQPFQPGDVIHLKRGSSWTSSERDGFVIDDSGVEGSPITFTAYGVGARPVFRNPGGAPGNQKNAITVDADWVVLEGIKVQEASQRGISIRSGANHNVVRDIEAVEVGIGVALYGQHNLVTQSYMHDLTMIINDPGGNNDTGAVGVRLYNSNNEVSYNKMINCKAPSYDYGVDGGVVEFYGNTHNNYVHHNWGENSAGFLEVGGGSASNNVVAYNLSLNNGRFSHLHLSGNYASDVQDFRVENNTIVQTVDDEKAWAQFGFSAEPEQPNVFILRNNLVYQIDMSYVSNRQNFTHDHNLYYFIGGTLGFELGEGEIEGTDPQFVSVADKDFHLQPGSPAIDGGIDLGYSLDFEDQPVPFSEAPDMGAFEHHAY